MLNPIRNWAIIVRPESSVAVLGSYLSEAFKVHLGGFLCSCSEGSNEKKKKGARVVPTPDRVWHKDSHYWSQLIEGVHKIQMLIGELLEEFLQ